MLAAIYFTKTSSMSLSDLDAAEVSYYSSTYIKVHFLSLWDLGSRWPVEEIHNISIKMPKMSNKPQTKQKQPLIPKHSLELWLFFCFQHPQSGQKKRDRLSEAENGKGQID